jgi:hypothetical protein
MLYICAGGIIQFLHQQDRLIPEILFHFHPLFSIEKWKKSTEWMVSAGHSSERNRALTL